MARNAYLRHGWTLSPLFSHGSAFAFRLLPGN